MLLAVEKRSSCIFGKNHYKQNKGSIIGGYDDGRDRDR